MKILDFCDTYILESVDWTTVIDLHMDRLYMKKILTRGTGADRCEIQDELVFKL